MLPLVLNLLYIDFDLFRLQFNVVKMIVFIIMVLFAFSLTTFTFFF